MKNAVQNTFQIVPLPEEAVRTLRTRKQDDAGNPLVERRDAARHQCRSCLTLTEPFEPYYAVSYAPMRGTHAFAERGPVYIHVRECAPWASPSEYPNEFPREAVVLRAYGASEEIEDARYVGSQPVESVIAELFANPAVRFVHARNSTYGCFMFEVRRASKAPDPAAGA